MDETRLDDTEASAPTGLHPRAIWSNGTGCRHGSGTGPMRWSLLVLFMSGLMIFNAYPRLHWGHIGSSHDPAWLEIGGDEDARLSENRRQRNPHHRRARPLAQCRGRTAESRLSLIGRLSRRAFRCRSRAIGIWPLLGYCRLALTLYMLRSLFNGHIRKDLHIRRAEWSPRHIWHDIKDHARLRFPTGAAALNYNILQKLSYIGVIFILLPLMIATGLCMSPGMNAGIAVAARTIRRPRNRRDRFISSAPFCFWAFSLFIWPWCCSPDRLTKCARSSPAGIACPAAGQSGRMQNEPLIPAPPPLFAGGLPWRGRAGACRLRCHR